MKIRHKKLIASGIALSLAAGVVITGVGIAFPARSFA